MSNSLYITATHSIIHKVILDQVNRDANWTVTMFTNMYNVITMQTHRQESKETALQ